MGFKNDLCYNFAKIYSGAKKPKYDSIFSLSDLNYAINLFSLSSFNDEIDAKLKTT